MRIYLLRGVKIYSEGITRALILSTKKWSIGRLLSIHNLVYVNLG